MKLTANSRRLIANDRKKYIASNADVAAGKNLLEVSLQNADCVDALYGIELVLVNVESSKDLQDEAIKAFSEYASNRNSLSDLERYLNMHQTAKPGSCAESVIGHAVIDTAGSLSKATNSSLKNGFVVTSPDVAGYKKYLEAAQSVFEKVKVAGSHRQKVQAYSAASLITVVAPEYIRLSACTQRSAHKDVNAGMIALNKLFRYAKAKGDVSEWKSIANDVAEEVAELCLTEKLQKDYAVAMYPLAAKAKEHLDKERLYVKGYDGTFERIKQNRDELTSLPLRGEISKQRRPQGCAWG